MPREHIDAHLPDDTVVLNLGGMPVTLSVLSWIINHLESGKAVAIVNAHHDQGSTPTAFSLGMQFQRALDAQEKAIA